VSYNGTHSLVVEPSSCHFPADVFRVEGPALVLIKRQDSTSVLCDVPLPLPELRGRIKSITAHGVEAAGASKIYVDLLWVSSTGRSRALAEVNLNGTSSEPKTEARGEIDPQRARFGPGGRLRLHIRYGFAGPIGQMSAEMYRLDRVAIEFEHNQGDVYQRWERLRGGAERLVERLTPR
jgi:hypothetical protein